MLKEKWPDDQKRDIVRFGQKQPSEKKSPKKSNLHFEIDILNGGLK